MIAYRLKKSILRSAMRGELTTQIKGDSSIFELITNEDVVKNEENDNLWELPDNWSWVKFGNLVDFKMGKTPERSNSIYWGNDVPWISITDMNNQPLIKETKEKVSKYALEKSFGGQISPKGTLIMSFKLTVGRTSILDIDALHNEAIISIFPKMEAEIQKQYLFYILPEIANMGETKDAIKGKTLNSKSIHNLFIPLPPKEEQKRIVEKLEVLLAEIDKLEQDEKALKELEDKFPKQLKNAILQAAITGKIFIKEESYYPTRLSKNNKPIHDDIVLDLPNLWEKVYLGDIVELLGGFAFKSSNYVSKEKGVRVIRISDFNESGLIDKNPVYYKDDSSLDKYQIFENDIILCMTGGTVGKNTFIKNKSEKLYLNQRVAVIRNKFEDIVDIRYIYYVINSPLTQQTINDNKNSTNDNISMGQIKKFIVPLPPVDIQKRIVEKLDEVFSVDLLNI